MLTIKKYSENLLSFLFSALFTNFLLLQYSFASINLEWDPPTTNIDSSPLTDLSHYFVKLGRANESSYFSTTTIYGTSYLINNLQNGSYFASVTALDVYGNESSESNKIYFVVADGGLDSDADGINDEEERNIGTSPLLLDSDFDGISDGQEVQNSTNPLDRRSHMPIYENKICAPWNGFLIDPLGRSMANIYEQLNKSNRDLNVHTQVLNSFGLAEENYNFQLFSGLQKDLLVHDFQSRQSNSYGTVCSESDGDPGDLSGTMVYYKSAIKTSGYDFALAIPATPPIRGTQYLPLNTFNPSSAPGDAQNIIGSWVQIINNNPTIQSGVLKFWRADSLEVKQVFISLEPNSRKDVAMHEIGSNTTGFVEWLPNDLTARFKVDSTRYFSDNSNGINSFEGAAYLPAFIPSGETIGAAYDNKNSSAILELSNVLDTSASVSVIIYSLNGAKLFEKIVSLNARGSSHIILDEYVPGEKGLIIVKPNSVNSVFSNLMQYKRRSNGGFYYLYAVPLVPPIGHSLVGSYNTWIGHQNSLLIANFGSSNQSVQINMTRLTGEKLINAEVGIIPSHGLSVINLNEREAPNNYGLIKVDATSSHLIAAWVIRERPLEYGLPFQLTQ